MSAEQADEKGIAPVGPTPDPDVLADSLLEEWLAKRSKEILGRIKRSEESQRCTAETMRLQFHGPGGG